MQDLYPEVALALGVPSLPWPLGPALTALRDRSLQAAIANVAVADRMAERIATHGVDRERIHVIPNWCNDEEIVPVSPADNPLRQQWDLQDKFVVGYSGNLGRAHDINTILNAAENLSDRSRIVFLFIGGGHGISILKDQVKKRALDRTFRFMPYQDRSDLKHSLSVPNVHWITLKPELEGLLLPSKFYGVAAAGRPMIIIGANDGELTHLIKQYQCGIAVEQGNSDSLVSAIVALSEDSHRCAAMGRNARNMLEIRFTRKQAFERWQTILANARE